jgi:hypothetical protein
LLGEDERSSWMDPGPSREGGFATGKDGKSMEPRLERNKEKNLWIFFLGFAVRGRCAGDVVDPPMSRGGAAPLGAPVRSKLRREPERSRPRDLPPKRRK